MPQLQSLQATSTKALWICFTSSTRRSGLQRTQQMSDWQCVQSVEIGAKCALCFSDAAVQVRAGSSSQGGFVISLINTKVLEGKSAPYSIVAWRSYKLPKVCRSSLSAEAQSCATALDELMMVKTSPDATTWCRSPSSCNSCWHLRLCNCHWCQRTLRRNQQGWHQQLTWQTSWNWNHVHQGGAGQTKDPTQMGEFRTHACWWHDQNSCQTSPGWHAAEWIPEPGERQAVHRSKEERQDAARKRSSWSFPEAQHLQLAALWNDESGRANRDSTWTESQKPLQPWTPTRTLSMPSTSCLTLPWSQLSWRSLRASMWSFASGGAAVDGIKLKLMQQL